MHKPEKATDPFLREYYEPEPAEREWYRDAQTGDLGWLVRREGVTHVRLDRKQEITRPYRPLAWVKEEQARPLTPTQIGEITFESDKALCRALGKHDLAKRDWKNLSDLQRSAWVANGPESDEWRIKWWQYAVSFLSRVAK